MFFMIMALMAQDGPAATPDLERVRGVYTMCEPNAQARQMEGLAPEAQGVDAMRDALWNSRYDQMSMCQMMSAALWTNDQDKMLTLYALGRVHYYYDKARCVEPDARGPYDSLHATVNISVSQTIFATPAPDMKPRMQAILTQLLTDPRVATMEAGLDQACHEVLPRAQWPTPEKALSPAG